MTIAITARPRYVSTFTRRRFHTLTPGSSRTPTALTSVLAPQQSQLQHADREDRGKEHDARRRADAEVAGGERLLVGLELERRRPAARPAARQHQNQAEGRP